MKSKRIISLILVLMMIVGIVTVANTAAFAADEEITETKDYNLGGSVNDGLSFRLGTGHITRFSITLMPLLRQDLPLSRYLPPQSSKQLLRE